MTLSTSARIVVVVAAYNEAPAIRDVVEALVSRCPQVVVVDDGSTDGTASRLAGSGATVLRHEINRGQGAALQTGIRFALLRGAQVIVTFDADGQHDPDDIEALVTPVLDGECDVALGSRFLARAPEIPLGRKLLLKAAIFFTRVVSRVRVTDAHNGLRALSREAAAALRITMDRMAHASEILDQLRIHGLRYREVPVTIRYTAYSLAKGQQSRDAIRIALQVILDKIRQ
jgi:glycosyltransferase involved in cell wall biosynthesis